MMIKKYIILLAIAFLNQLLAMAQNNTLPLIIAHRGASGTAPENTLASIDKALKAGADMIEIDIHQTKDGELVVIHDESIDRTTNGSGKINEMVYSDIKKYSAGLWYSEDFKAETVPTLSDVIRLINGKAKLLIEVKGNSIIYPGIEAETVKIINDLHAISWCEIQSFNTDFLNTFYKISPELKLYKLIVSDIRFLPFYFDEKVSFGNLKDFNFTVGINPNHKFASKHYIDKVHDMNQKVFCWTVNEKNDFERLKKNGVDGIITNYPERFINKSE